MKIVFLSNYFNHHQQLLCGNLYKKNNVEFRFVSTNVMRQDRRKLGYETAKPPFVLHTYLGEAECKSAERWILDSDVVVIGSAPAELLKPRRKTGKLILRYSERPLKKGFSLWKYPFRFISWRIRNRYSSDIYMLCASAYTMSDYAKFMMYRNRCYRWGYFPETKKYADVDKLLNGKKKSTLLWVGRFLDWKHPDAAVRLAKRLKEDGYQFELNIIGTGEMEVQLKEMITDLNLNDCVHMLGSMKPERVREYMEQSQIYLFTSDRNEGWGAVLNESMNSGCAVVASHAIGSVPFLMKDHENGLVYESGNENQLFCKVKYLLDNPTEQKRMGKNAYQTILLEWNAEVAAERLMQLSQHILAGERSPDLFESGPCSKAKIIKDTWYTSNR